MEGEEKAGAPGFTKLGSQASRLGWASDDTSDAYVTASLDVDLYLCGDDMMTWPCADLDSSDLPLVMN